MPLAVQGKDIVLEAVSDLKVQEEAESAICVQDNRWRRWERRPQRWLSMDIVDSQEEISDNNIPS